MSSSQPRVALFLDAENFSTVAGQGGYDVLIEKLIEVAREHGLVVYSRAYADWSETRMVPIMRKLQEFGVQMEQLCTGFKGKNTADMQLTVDALEMCFSDHAMDVLVLASGDRDFVPLVHKLRRRAVKVVGIGFANTTGKTLRNVCNEFVFYENLLPPAGVASDPVQVEAQAALVAAMPELVSRAVALIEGKGGRLTGSSLNLMLRQLEPAFDFRTLGFASFRQFVESESCKHVVIISGPSGGDIALARIEPAAGDALVAPGHVAPGMTPVDPTLDPLSQYVAVLNTKGVRVLPYSDRHALVSALIREMQFREDGMTIQDMNGFVQQTATTREVDADVNTLNKISQTLNIGDCFTDEVGNDPKYHRDMTAPLILAVENAEEALAKMEAAYVGGLLLAKVEPEANHVAEWLYGSTEPSEVARAQAAIAAARREVHA